MRFLIARLSPTARARLRNHNLSPTARVRFRTFATLAALAAD